MFTDFTFWLIQQPPETQQWTILGIVVEFIVLLVVGGIVEYIKRKKEE